MKYHFNLTPEEEAEALETLSPTGFRVLVALAKTDEKVGSLYIPDSRRSDEEVASILAKVIEVGPDAYQDPTRFPNGRFCKVGDVVMMASYTGRRFKIEDREYRLINDDSVIAVVHQPEKVSRA